MALAGSTLAMMSIPLGCSVEEVVDSKSNTELRGFDSKPATELRGLRQTPQALVIPTPTTVPPVTPNELATPTPTPRPKAQISIEPAPQLPDDWHEPIPLDREVSDGQLENGLRFLIRENGSPGEQAQLRLLVKAGSLQEADGQKGAAHFLEHMMFNGTKRYPANRIVQVLEEFGSSFGPDINAYTSYEQTVYELLVPAGQNARIDEGLRVLRDWADQALLDDQAVTAERGVVREEHRLRTESAEGRLRESKTQALLGDTRYGEADPVGPREAIDSMTSDTLVDYYERWYRPELMTVIAVGDFSAATVEAQIASEFGDLVGSERLPAQSIDDVELPSESTGVLPKAKAEILLDPELHRFSVEIYWRRTGEPLRTLADVRREAILALAQSVLDYRLERELMSPSSVFTSANTISGRPARAYEVFGMVGVLHRPNPTAAISALVVEVERLRQHGVSSSELALAKASLLAQADDDLARADSRQDAQIAEELVAYAVDGAWFAEAESRNRMLKRAFESVTSSDIERLADDLLAGPPYININGPAGTTQLDTTPREALDVYGEHLGSVVDAPNISTGDAVGLMEAPAPKSPVARNYLPALDTTVIEYENGARLAYRLTEIELNTIEFEATSVGGFFATDGEHTAVMGRADEIVVGSGFETHDALEVARLLADENVALSVTVGRSLESLRGTSATEDLETLMQLVHLQMTEPTIDSLRMRRFESRWRAARENPDADPSLAATLELWRLRYGDSAWYRPIPSLSDLDSLDYLAVLEEFKERFDDAGDFIFVFVGDIDEQQLLDLSARYIATLPDGGRRDSSVERDPGLPEENLVETVEIESGGRGLLKINWESPYENSLEAELKARALELILNARLRDHVREALGASYAPTAEITVLALPTPWIDSIVEIWSDPDRVVEVSDAVRDELARLRTGDIDVGYLDLAKAQLLHDARFVSNRELLEQVETHLMFPERLASEYDLEIHLIQALTPEDIAETARLAFPPQRSVEVRAVPAG